MLGAIVYRIGTVQLADLAGIGRQMPLTMAAFVVAGLGLIGAPGTAGFISKWYLAVGALREGLVAAGVPHRRELLLAMVYIGRVVEVAWFREPSAPGAESQGPAAVHAGAGAGPRGRDDLFRLRHAGLGGHCQPGRARAARGAQMIPPLAPDTLMLLAIAIPFVGAALIPLFHRWPNLRER